MIMMSVANSTMWTNLNILEDILDFEVEIKRCLLLDQIHVKAEILHDWGGQIQVEKDDDYDVYSK